MRHNGAMSTLLRSLVMALPLVGCGGVGPTVCTTEYRYGLTITLKDGAGTPICDATVVAVDGAYRETLKAMSCEYGGAGERAGVYDVTITKSGFKTTTINVGVSKDECHVHTEVRNLTLTP